jgi:uncharacterized protein (DUF305 family)
MALQSVLIPSALLLLTATSWSQQDTPTIVQPGAPGASSRTLSAAEAAITVKEPSEADTKFMQGMIMHHAQAVEMTALMPTRTHNKELLAFGKRISISQTDEIKFMQQWLEDRGKAVPTEHDRMAHMQGMDHSKMDHSKMDHSKMAGMNSGAMTMDMGSMPMMPGMLTPQQMQALAKATGATFDRLFLTGMIQHHNGALTMVQDLFATPAAGQDSQLFDFATDVDNTQSAEIKIMQGMLKEKK